MIGTMAIGIQISLPFVCRAFRTDIQASPANSIRLTIRQVRESKPP